MYKPIDTRLYPDTVGSTSRDKDRERLDTYLKLFNSAIERRITTLFHEVEGKYTVVYSTASLLKLASYLDKNLYIRVISLKELTEKINFTSMPSSIAKNEYDRLRKYEICEPTSSILFDLGMYVGEMMRFEQPEMYWEIEREQEYASYAFPILKTNHSEYSFSPYWRLIIFTHKLLKKKVNPEDIVSSYTKWKEPFL